MDKGFLGVENYVESVDYFLYIHFIGVFYVKCYIMRIEEKRYLNVKKIKMNITIKKTRKKLSKSIDSTEIYGKIEAERNYH